MDFLFPRLTAFFRRHGTYLSVLIVLALLSVLSYCICEKVAAGELRIGTWATHYVFPIAIPAVFILAFFHRYFLSLSLLIGYHAGILLSAVGVPFEEMHFSYALIAFFSTVAIFLMLGIWAEVFAYLLQKWKAEKEQASDESGTST